MWKWFGVAGDKTVTESEVVKESSPESADGNKPSVNEQEQSNATSENLKKAAGNLGNYLYNFANVASKTASKLKETVDEKLDKTIVGDFQRENEKFIQENEARRIGDAVPPWVGYHEELSMKQQIMALSDDERNFLRDPPQGVDFQFQLSHMMPVAMAALKEDQDLKEMRFKLVPKRVKEEMFWRNYFYRVSLIKQSTQLSSMADIELKKSSNHSSTENLKDVEEFEKETESFQDVTEAADSPVNHEFVSDAFVDDKEGLSEEEKNQMLGKQTSDDSKKLLDDAELDRELQEELESFELVNDNSPDMDGNWEKEIEDMLEFEVNDKPK